MNSRPCLHKFQLFYRQTSRNQLSVYADLGFILCIIYMKMRFVVLIVVTAQHLYNNVEKPTQLRHCHQPLFQIHYSTFANSNQQTPSHVAEKENPAEPCTPQKKTLHSKAVSAALLCASNVRCGRAAREACIPAERYRIPFKSCRFRYGCVSRAKQEKVSKALLSVYAYARVLCAQFSSVLPSSS